jgi:hypothetical protein
MARKYNYLGGGYTTTSPTQGGSDTDNDPSSGSTGGTGGSTGTEDANQVDPNTGTGSNSSEGTTTTQSEPVSYNPPANTNPPDTTTAPITSKAMSDSSESVEASNLPTAPSSPSPSSSSANDGPSLGTILAAGVGLATVGGIALNRTRNKDEDDPKRVFNRSKKLARGLWNKEFRKRAMDEGSNSDKLLDQLQRDFVREGPLYLASQKGTLYLSPDRNSWIIETKKGDGWKDLNVAVGRTLVYNDTNFGKAPGFAVDIEEVSAYAIDSATQRIFTNLDLKRKKQSGQWVLTQTSADTVAVIDEVGNKFTLDVVLPDFFVPEWGNTAEGFFNRREYNPSQPADVIAPTNQAVMDLEAEIAALEAGLGNARKKGKISLDDYLRAEAAQGKTLDKQEEFDKRQKALADEREKQRKDAEAAKIKRDADTVSRNNENLARETPDASVDTIRYKIELEFMQAYVDSGLGYTMDRADIVNWSYELTPSGPKLKIEFTPEKASALGQPTGYNSQEFTRESLIGIRALPVSFGPGYVPYWKSGSGLSPEAPNWAGKIAPKPSADLMKSSGAAPVKTARGRWGSPPSSGMGGSQTALPLGGGAGGAFRFRGRGFPRHNSDIKRTYFRNLNASKFVGTQSTFSRENARAIAGWARNARNLNARVIPSANGYRVYLGRKMNG